MGKTILTSQWSNLKIKRKEFPSITFYIKVHE